MRRFLASLSLALAPVMAPAHPHVFIDTGVELLVDPEGRLTHVRVTWAYDELYSLLVLEDQRLDNDMDGVLSPGEEARLKGFDAQWVEDYDGDLVVVGANGKVALSHPIDATATTEDGRIVTTHLRAVEGAPVRVQDLSLKAFDPSFYTAYDMTRPVVVTGVNGCELTRFEPDIDAELERMQSFLLTLDADADLEENDIPMVGENFATEIRVSCPVS